MNKRQFCFLQVSDRLLNPDDKSNPADNYFKAIWPNMAGEGYYRPEHYWEIPTWIAELSHCLKDKDHELMLYHIDEICPDDCGARSPHYPVLPEADIYFASVMDCNKEILARIVHNNPDKQFFFGGYIGHKGFCEIFYPLGNVLWCNNTQDACEYLDLDYQYGTDYRLFKGMKCIPRLTLSNGCTNHCKFCTVPDEITQVPYPSIGQQTEAMECLDFELVYINDKTFGQCHNYIELKYIYNTIKAFNPKFRGFTVQTTCAQVERQEIDFHVLQIVNVELGIESYNNEILRKYNKPQNTRSIDRAIDVLKRWNVNIIPNIIIGLPGETLNTYVNTWEWLEENKQDFLMLNVTNFVPYAGSDASDIVKTQPGDFNQTVCERSYHTRQEAMAVGVFTNLLFDLGIEIIEATKARSSGVYDEPMCTKMPRYCNKWPCPGNEESKLEPDENGFMCCIKCGGSYGKK